MSKLLDMIFGLFGKYVSHFTYLLGKKYALAASIVAIWITFVVTFSTAMTLIMAIANVTYTFNTYIVFGFSLLPENSQEVVAAIMSAYAASWSYVFYTRILNTKSSVYRNM